MKNKLFKLVEKNGFLLFLFVCVCVLAIGTIVVSNRNVNNYAGKDNKELIILEDPENKEISSDLNVDGFTLEEDMLLREKVFEVAELEDELFSMGSVDEETEEVFKEDVEEENLTNEVEGEEGEDDELEKSSNTILPVEGNVITEYTTDGLIYSKTLEEWRAHPGIDIKAEKGTKVVAPLDGTIKELYEDRLWGIVVVIDHGDNLETKLANLGTMEMLKLGLKVKQGEHISTVGKTANIEMLMEDHIHYETRKNGKLVDPRSITP